VGRFDFGFMDSLQIWKMRPISVAARKIQIVSHMLELRKLVGSRPLFSPGATVLALNEAGQILMQLRSDTKTWGFPGGSSELGDSLLQAAQRELLEETGLTASSWNFVTILSGSEFFYIYPNGDQIFNVAAIYLARGLSDSLHMDHESLELRWFNPDDFPTDLAGPITRWVVDHLEGILTT
jgi:8-oxo-dGTP pyrophosphatase MutT (NUDIX family)